MTIPIERVVTPTATTGGSTIEPTKEMMGRQSRGEKTGLASHDKDKNSGRHRGRPRISTTDLTQIEATCLNFQEKVLASGVLDQTPELSHCLWSMVETITSLTHPMVPDQDVDGNDAVLLSLKTQNSKADQEKIESLAAEERHPDFGRECKGNAAGVDRPSSIPPCQPAKNISEHKARNVNVPDIEIQGRGASQGGDEYLMEPYLPRHRLANLVALCSPSIRLPFQNEMEERFFRSYMTKTTVSLSWIQCQDFASTLWDCLIMQAAHDEAFVRDAIIAIGALTESKMALRRGSSVEAPEMRRFALHRYGRAIRTMRSSLAIRETSDNPRKALIGCLLVCCFEGLNGNSFTALSHARSGNELLRDWLKNHKWKAHNVGICSPASEIIEDELVQAFARLDDQVATHFSSRSLEEHEILMNEGNETVERMPSTFSDVHEARLYLELIERRATHFMCTVTGSLVRNMNDQVARSSEDPENQGEIPKKLQVERNKFAQEVIRWGLAFQRLYASIPALSSSLSVAANMLLARCSVMDIVITSSLDTNDNTSFDKHLPEFNAIVLLCESILNATKDSRCHGDYMFDVGIVMPLHAVSKWCRDRTVRRRAISLLRSYTNSDGEPMREGVWDSSMVAEWNQRYMELEEEGVETEFIPEHARIRVTEITVNPEKKYGWCEYVRGSPGFERPKISSYISWQRNRSIALLEGGKADKTSSSPSGVLILPMSKFNPHILNSHPGLAVRLQNSDNMGQFKESLRNQERPQVCCPLPSALFPFLPPLTSANRSPQPPLQIS
ncbi:uncharacterized protein PAC_17983 [Phialocephala subalpina]|uniref:Uncharacterized protein n=1 Tax=Phialocephala subalpina TaxID=576137 RepID=A0A1L7XSR9_9HELO|nr:uncharacterized protein PAC_17983 [Phialocephala subalpina]